MMPCKKRITSFLGSPFIFLVCLVASCTPRSMQHEVSVTQRVNVGFDNRKLEAIKKNLRYLSCAHSHTWTGHARDSAKAIHYSGIDVFYTTEECRPLAGDSFDSRIYSGISMNMSMTFESYVKTFKPGEFLVASRPKCSVLARICKSITAVIARSERWNNGVCVCAPYNLERHPDNVALQENVDVTIEGMIACVPQDVSLQVSDFMIEEGRKNSSPCVDH